MAKAALGDAAKKVTVVPMANVAALRLLHQADQRLAEAGDD
jgi:hypothetical protein